MVEEIAPIGNVLSQNKIDFMDIASTSNMNFSSFLVDKIENADEIIANADLILEKFSLGQDISIHEAMIAMQKAKIELSFVVEARNKVLEVYQEVMRMQL